MTMESIDGECEVRHAPRHFAEAMYGSDWDFFTHCELPRCRYVLATMPRAGSTLFSTRLWQTGLLGAPLEYLNFGLARRLFERLGYPVKEVRTDAVRMGSYWRNLQRLRTSANGVFGCKLFVSNLVYMANRLPDFLNGIRPTHVVYLTRMDLVGQAISYSRAQRSRAWFGGVRVSCTPEYDFEHIRGCLVSLCWQMAVWERLFKSWGVPLLRVNYEQLCKRPRQVVSEVANHLGVPRDPSAKFSLPLLVRQADRTTCEWRARFISDAASTTDPLAA
jgi:LPS sulfotransferase NodH